jgi:hypothetical protein
MTSFKSADIFKAITGAVSGGRAGTLTAAGALSKTQGAVQTAAQKLGAKIGIYTGGNVFASLAKGAQATDTARVDQITTEELGYSATALKTYGVFIVLGVGLYFLFRK